MTSRMLRGCMKAVALAAVAALAPVSSAQAGGGEKSPFAGTYDWKVGTVYSDSWAVTISDGGQITGSLVSTFTYTKGSISGRVSADGSYSFTVSVTFRVFDDPDRPRHGPEFRTAHYKFAGNMAPDAEGNIVGTPDTGESFVWLRN